MGLVPLYIQPVEQEKRIVINNYKTKHLLPHSTLPGHALPHSQTDKRHCRSRSNAMGVALRGPLLIGYVIWPRQPSCSSGNTL